MDTVLYRETSLRFSLKKCRIQSQKNGIGKKDLGSRHILLWLLKNIFDHDDDANNRLSDGVLGGLVQTMLFQVIPFNSPPLSLSEVSQRRWCWWCWWRFATSKESQWCWRKQQITLNVKNYTKWHKLYFYRKIRRDLSQRVRQQLSWNASSIDAIDTNLLSKTVVTQMTWNASSIDVHWCRWQSNARVEGRGCSRVYGGICLIGWGQQGKEAGWGPEEKNCFLKKLF